MSPVAQPPSEDDAHAQALADALQEVHRRRAVGEPVDLDSMRDRLGPRFAELTDVLAAEEALDAALADDLPGPEELPRPFGPYTLLRELGRGGVGVVYEAVERGLGRAVAVKVLRLALDDDPQVLARFQREASACAGVRHDCIVAVHGHGLAEGRAYYAMDLVRGAPLSRLIVERRLPAARDLARGLAGIADALATLHATGTVHRDVKPANVLVREDGRMILADFGLARTLDSVTLTRTGAMVGTPAYMAPEQVLARQDAIDARSDVYGLGAVLYECLALRVPFQTLEWAQLISMILSQRPVPPSDLAPDVPADLSRIALKALEKDPGDRYPTAAAMALDLRRFAEGREVLGRPVSPLRRVARGARRRWLPLTAAAAALLGAALWWSGRPGTLHVPWAWPKDAVVAVDGRRLGPAPVTLEVSAGTHVVELSRAQFTSRRLEVSVGRWAERDAVLEPLEVADGAGEDVRAAYLEEMARALGLTSPDLRAGAPAAMTRVSGMETPVRILAPRGPVRAEDLSTWWVEVDPEAYVPGGRLELRAGERVLWSAELKATAEQTFGRFALEPGALGALAPDAALTFGYVAPGGSVAPDGPATAALRLVDATPSARRLQPIDALFGASRSQDWRLLRALALRDQGLTTAALRETSAGLGLPGEARAGTALMRTLLVEAGARGARACEELEDLLRDRAPGPVAWAAGLGEAPGR